MFTTNSPQYTSILHDCRILRQRLGDPELRHCFREQNKVDDLLAKEGLKIEKIGGPTVLVLPPSTILPSLMLDISGATYRRSISSDVSNVLANLGNFDAQVVRTIFKFIY